MGEITRPTNANNHAANDNMKVQTCDTSQESMLATSPHPFFSYHWDTESSCALAHRSLSGEMGMDLRITQELVDLESEGSSDLLLQDVAQAEAGYQKAARYAEFPSQGSARW